MLSTNVVRRALIAVILLALGLFVAIATADPASSQGQTVSATLVPGVGRGASEFRVRGLDPEKLATLKAKAPTTEEWKTLLGVSVASQKGEAGLPPILGSYRIDRGEIVFVPRYSIDRSIRRYRMLIEPSLLPKSKRPSASERFELIIRSEPGTSADTKEKASSVATIFPSAPELPENTLRFYIWFSAPMSRGEAYQHLSLTTRDGRKIADPFLELDEELWSVDGKRFTLLIDPGRIKKGLKPREEVGPVLEVGQEYTLIVSRDWRDANGFPLSADVRKSFRASAADERSPAPSRWTIRAPKAGTTDALVVDFHEPLDRALAERLIVVEAPGGTILGEVPVLDRNESVWSVIPARPWEAGAYRLLVGNELEDLAGNSVGRQFEVDLVEPITKKIESSNVALPFVIKAEAR